jgi:hypothetical protein
MTLRRTIIAVLIVFVMASLGASWTAVWLLAQASDARQVQAELAEVRTEAAVVCLLGSIAGRDEMVRPSEDETAVACARFLKDAGVDLEIGD